jgi:hypothetical protein
MSIKFGLILHADAPVQDRCIYVAPRAIPPGCFQPEITEDSESSDDPIEVGLQITVTTGSFIALIKPALIRVITL